MERIKAEQLLQKIQKAYHDIAPRIGIEVNDSFIKELAFDYVDDGTLLFQFYGMHDEKISKEIVDFFCELIRSICLIHGIIFFYLPPDEDKN